MEIIVKDAELYNMGKPGPSGEPDGANDDPDAAYPMQSSPRGYALIINNIEFEGRKDLTRQGAQLDAENLSELLRQFGFLVTYRQNVKHRQLKRILIEFKSQFSETSVDACLVAIMSHGDDNYIIHPSDMNNMAPWDLKDILKNFNNRHFPEMKGKPKVFIVAMCLGSSNDTGVTRTQRDSNPGNTATVDIPSRNIPETEDMVVCYSTVPGYVSIRDPDAGTWYISTLCKVFMQHAWNTELLDLLRLVGRRMRSLSTEEGNKQMSSFHVIGFHYKMYFNPGLYEAPRHGPDPDQAAVIREEDVAARRETQTLCIAENETRNGNRIEMDENGDIIEH